ncbi:uncharacterized protein LOC141726650 [Zonotrichia albicollis]|uniref:uncharacterized protein LOC141726650 n=1 Tax=Zonotrichia albicollis TaxID=44394 RepID=UPI003D80EE34
MSGGFPAPCPQREKTRRGMSGGCPAPPASRRGGAKLRRAKKFFFTLSPEPAQTEPSPPPPSLSPGGWEWAVPLEPVPLVPPLPALRPPSRPASPERPPLQAIPSPPLQAVPPLPAPASENAEETLPVAAELLSDDDASPASGSAEELFSPAPPAPLPLPSASSPPQAETVPVQDGAGDGAEPAGPSEKPAAAPTSSEISSPVPASSPLPAQAAPAVLPLSEAVSSVSASETALEPAACSSSDHPGPVAVAGAPAAGLPFRGAGAARQLTGGTARLPAFKISILGGVGGGFSGIVPWRLPSLPPLLRPSGGGQVHPESSASDLQPGGGGDDAMGRMRHKPNALQGKRAQIEETIAGLLWETNISRPQMGSLGKASISLLLACLSGFGERKRVPTRAAIVLAAGCRPVGMQGLPHGFGLGRWAQEVFGPGPAFGLLVLLGVEVSPTGPGPPLWASFGVPGPSWARAPKAFPSLALLCFAAALFFFDHKKKKKKKKKKIK